MSRDISAALPSPPVHPAPALTSARRPDEKAELLPELPFIERPQPRPPFSSRPIGFGRARAGPGAPAREGGPPTAAAEEEGSAEVAAGRRR